MDSLLPPQRVEAGNCLLEAMERDRLNVVACYWRRLRPTRGQWALVISLAEFGPDLRAGLARLLDAWESSRVAEQGLQPLDLWALEPDHEEPRQYARAVARRRTPWPRTFEGNGSLEPALLYRLPAL